MKAVTGLGWGALILALALAPLLAVDLIIIYLLEDTVFRILSTLAMLGCFYLSIYCRQSSVCSLMG
ncbi:hypothetical protein [Exiguobacterium sp. KJ 601]|uniref:hypothetical protein n=1 Tax=Exiguobacterium sp. KJ 601 TaxID=2782569 RepID=UPI0022AE8C97|nr:hypothetical protein [Exiguobacterium sp. KJ 601]